ncbi:hypothetical protein PLICRDRAFT_176665 [Plicaturopsis crispa FD-325 SS-3]|nr:hypothetical protein PLICRDRAFT_176665 [Plicaturopsis crispa FD-325 SS-3]
MNTSSQHPKPLARLSRLALSGRALLSPTSPSARSPQSARDEDEWYIPYNGPYEIPKDGSTSTAFSSNAARKRSASIASTKTGKGRAQAPTFINLGAASGIGESPVAHTQMYYGDRNEQNNAQSPTSPPHEKRTSFFGFGRRRSILSVKSKDDVVVSPLEEEPVRGDDDAYYNSYYSTLIGTPTSGSGRFKLSKGKGKRPPVPARSASDVRRENSSRSEMESPVTTTRSPAHPSSQPRSQGQHPYAYPFPSSSPTPKVDSPPITAAKTTVLPSVTLTQPEILPSYPSQSADPFAATVNMPPSSHALRTSTSTPNFRAPPPPARAPTPPHRWLSAETWCDALLFPRPRFRVRLGSQSRTSTPTAKSHQNGGGSANGSGRIVSPPDSPIHQHQDSRDGSAWQESGVGREKAGAGLKTRGLMKSRSHADLLSSTNRSVLNTTEGKTAPDPNLLSVRRSFAQDDLALPSPVPSLARVLEEGDELTRQREQWQALAKHGFGNSVSRAHSRKRSKSLKNASSSGVKDKEPGGFDFLAARTLLGSQRVQVREHTTLERTSGTTGTVSSHTVSHSHSHSHAHSHASSKRQGHTRGDSWGKSALRLCGINGIDPTNVSPVDENGTVLERERAKDVPRKDTLAPISVPGLGGPPRISPTPSSMEGVGIAISTPPPSDDHSRETYDPISLPDHPYAQGASLPYSRDTPKAPSRSPSHSRTHSRRGSDYAGPHPSSHIVPPPTTGSSDVSFRHRLPPQATLNYQFTHPFAAQSPDEAADIHPRMRIDSNVPPPAKMYVELAPGDVREILPHEIQYSPLPMNPAEDDGIESQPLHAYAAATRNQHRETKLGVGEALSYTLHKQSSRDSGIGTSEDHDPNMPRDRRRPEIVRESSSCGPSSAKAGTSLAHRKPVMYDQADLPQFQRMTTQSTEPRSLHTVASSQIDRLAPPSAREISGTLSNRKLSDSNSSRVTSQDSSPQISPRPLGNGDDLERFRDLFYNPNQSEITAGGNVDTYASPESSRASEFSWEPTPREHHGLSDVVRQLSLELEEFSGMQEQHTPPHSHTRSPSLLSEQHFGRSHSGRRPPNISTNSFGFVSAEVDRSPSPNDETLPLRIPTRGIRHNDSSLNVPEDIASSRASSVLEPSPVEDDTFGVHLRMGSIEAVTTPPTTAGDHRISSHLTYLEDRLAQSGHPHDRGSADQPAESSTRILSTDSLQPPHSFDLARFSYVTSNTDTSRISNLSDFPVPPKATPGHMSLLQSYFENTPEQQAQDSADYFPQHPHDEPENSGNRRHPSYRMTFGGEEDIENIAAIHSSHI